MPKLTACLFALTALLWVACTPKPPPPTSAGIASLSPAITDTIIALNAGDQLVGRSDFCTGPPKIMALPTLGSGLTPNLEAIVATRPQMVLVEANQAADTSNLTQVARVESLPWLTLADVLQSTNRLGQLLDRPTEAAALANRLELALAPKAIFRPPRVLLVIGVDGPAGDIWFIKPNSLHGDALRAAGGLNAIPEDVTGAPSLTAERVIALDPDRIILLASHELDPTQRSEAIDAWKRLAPLRAAQSGQIHVIAKPNLLTVSPAVLDFIEALSPLVQHQAMSPE